MPDRHRFGAKLPYGNLLEFVQRMVRLGPDFRRDVVR